MSEIYIGMLINEEQKDGIKRLNYMRVIVIQNNLKSYMSRDTLHDVNAESMESLFISSRITIR